MEKPLHFRRCHLCGSLVKEEQGKVEKCVTCERSLAPFYYFDDRFTAIQGDNTLRPGSIEGEYAPILGLTVYWESF